MEDISGDSGWLKRPWRSEQHERASDTVQRPDGEGDPRRQKDHDEKGGEAAARYIILETRSIINSKGVEASSVSWPLSRGECWALFVHIIYSMTSSKRQERAMRSLLNLKQPSPSQAGSSV